MPYQLKVTMEESKPSVWRRILVPQHYTFYQLHMSIQGAFGWSNCHLFQFCQKDFSDKLVYGVPDPDFDLEMPVEDARKIKMTTELNSIGREYVYIYDFGDSWSHHILVEKINGEEMSRPFCIAGKGACPPEDCGGIFGYKEMLKALNAPRHPEKASYRRWIGLERGETWDASICNLREVNKRLALL